MIHNPNPSPDEILQDAVHIIGYEPTRSKPDRQGWVTFWCPFHDDIGRRGHSGRPNFGVNLKNGAWNCFVCGRKGPSLAKLAVALGSNYVPRDIPADLKSYSPDRAHESHVDAVTSALAECRANFLKSPAQVYVSDRGVRPLTAAIYGLGYGMPAPYIDRTTAMSAYASGMVLRNGVWQWAESVVYADPPIGKPTVINCRYLPEKYLIRKRPFKVNANHHTWGNRSKPLGAWRIGQTTQMIVVVEGLFDMLLGAQVVQEKNLSPEVCVVYTNGSSIKGSMLKWFRDNSSKYDFLLIRDPDEAGAFWEKSLKEVLGKKAVSLVPPDDRDPDEAFLAGWWPSAI
jgi:Toprim-like